MGKRIEFAGYECEDIVLYLARLLVFFGKRVAVEDRTEQGTVLKIADVCRVTGQQDGYYGEVLVTPERNAVLDGYDAVLTVSGYRCMSEEAEEAEEGVEEAEEVILVTDMTISRAALLRETNFSGQNRRLLVRDAVELKYGMEYLLQLAEGTEKGSLNGSLIPFSERDIRCKCYLETDRKVRLHCLSSGMKQVLSELLHRFIPELTKKQLRQAWRYA